MNIKKPSEYCHKDAPLYNYLGHFKEAKYLDQGHNDMARLRKLGEDTAAENRENSKRDYAEEEVESQEGKPKAKGLFRNVDPEKAKAFLKGSKFK